MAGLPVDAHIGEVHLTVSDLDRSVAFYTETLGFRLLDSRPADAVLGARADRPLIRLHGRAGARAKPRRSSGLFHVAILTPDRRFGLRLGFETVHRQFQGGTHDWVTRIRVEYGARF